jgi:tight adherence protein C
MSDWIDPLLLGGALVALVGFLLLRNRARDVERTGAVERGDAAEPPYRLAGFYHRLVRQAGFEPRAFLFFFWVMKIVLAVLVPLGLIQLLAGRYDRLPLWALVAAGAAGFFALDVWVGALRRERRRKIAYSLPYFLDLVVAFLRSGLGLEEAFRRAGREGFEPDHPLGREVRLVAHEIDLGKDRAAAFRALAERTGVPAMKAIAAALDSGLRLGASVEATLRSQADLLRNRRREETLKRVQLAALKALLPVMLCGFPLFGVIVFYPTFREILRTFAFLAGS